ncbi:MAG: VacB/RNase II family 3'-5' exoribonuclease, partial [Rikenellaceae bacterium]|nr:VacB/RNase II family 3'-5' exoribonuclease [Rikenellaceae bacterium]
WEIGVHIADVTHYVTEGTLLDKEALDRATSVYLVDRVVPMLPERLSNGLCSLRPGEKKLCFSAVFEMNDECEVLSEWFGRTVIYSDRRFTYDEAQQVIETGKGDLAEEITTLNRLALKMRADRFKNGSIAFERDEPKFRLDDKGHPTGVYFKVMKEANHLIEEFMLLANRHVARFIGSRKKGRAKAPTFVYRVHDKPNEEKYQDFRTFASKFGYTIKEATSDRAIARELNRFLGKIKGKKEENLFSILALRSMAKAIYSVDNIGHYGLAFDYYTHFTSPIRRYPDMMVHRLLQHYLDGGKSADRDHYEELCRHSSEREVRAAEAERASIKYKMVEFMSDKIGAEFDGFISGITDWGIFVELADTKIEGMVSVRDMTDDTYNFDQENYRLVGVRSRRVIMLGDAVRVRVLRADLKRKQLDYELVSHKDYATGREVSFEPDDLRGSSGRKGGKGKRRDKKEGKKKR